MQIIKHSKKQEIHNLFIVVCLTIILLSESNETCLDLIDKINEDPDDDSPMKGLLRHLVHEYSEFTADAVQKSPSTPPKKHHHHHRGDSDFAGNENHQMYEKLQKTELDLMCKDC